MGSHLAPARHTRAGRYGFLASALALLVASGVGAAAPASEGIRISFDSLEGLTCKRGYKCVEANAEVVKDDVREGSRAVKTTWKSADDNYGLVSMSVDIPETDLTGRSMSIRIKPLSRTAHIWGVEFYDADGNKLEEHRMFQLGEAQVCLQARLMSQALRKLTGSVSRSQTCLVFINQLRMQIGIRYGNPETTSGGRALRFYAAVRLDIRRSGRVKSGDEIVGNRTRVKVVKNKLAPPFRQAEFDLIFGEGISRELELLDLGVARGVVAQARSWLSFGELALGNGREQARLFLKQHPQLAEQIAQAIRVGGQPTESEERVVAQAS